MVKLDLNKKPRKYKTGINEAIIIKDLGNISLKNNEQVTFRFNKQKYDFRDSFSRTSDSHVRDKYDKRN